MRRTTIGSVLVGAAALALSGGLDRVWAAVAGHPEPGQIGFQLGVTSIANEIHSFHDYILIPIITLVCLLVLVLLGICAVRFNEKANPVPSKTTHHTLLEVAWTVLPVLLLV